MNDRAYKITLNPKCDGYQRGIASMLYIFFDKKIGSGVSVNEVIAQELHKPVIKTFKWKKRYARFKDNMSPDLVKTRSLSAKNRSVEYL